MEMTGRTILHYQIEERLGEGGMGVVYRATDTKLGRKVALKFLPAFVSRRPEEKQRFLQEARTASGLDHPNIATIFEVNEADSKIFYAMSLVEGVTLKDLRLQGPVTQKQIIQIAIQVADGLAHAHERDVVHRDIKPQNIMVTTEGRAVILDFGLAQVGLSDSPAGADSTSGTAAYLSPEQAQGLPATAQSDLFGFGVVLYELLTGESPFQGEHPAALLYSIVHEDPEPLLRKAPETAPQLAALVERLMAKDPRKRYPNAALVASDLRQMARELEYSSYSGQVRTLRKEPRYTWRSVAVALGALLALGWFASSLTGPSHEGAKVEDQYDVAVMYFEDLTGGPKDEKTGRVVSELLTTDLSQSPSLRVLSSQRLYDIMKQLGKAPSGATIDQSVATEVARRAGALNMITGTIAQSGDRTRIAVNLIDVASGRVVRAEQVEGRDLFTMVDSVSARLHQQMAVLLPDVDEQRPLRPVAEATTSNVHAYKHYINGLDAYHSLEWDSALSQFDSAIALDSNFALAYLRAAIASFSSNRAARGFQYVGFGRHALQSDLLPARESLLVAAFVHLADNQMRDAIEGFQSLIQRYPDDKEAYFWLGTFQWQSGDAAKGIENLKKSLELDPEFPFALINLAEMYKDLDDIQSAISITERYATLRPKEALPRLELGSLCLNLEQYDKARERFEEAERLAPHSIRVATGLAGYFAYRGFADSIRAVLEPFLTADTKITDRTTASDLWASALFLSGRFQESFAQYRETARLQRQFGDSLGVAGHWLAIAYRELAINQPDSAQAAFDQAYHIDPENQKFNDLPYRIALRKKDFARAETIRSKLMERYAKSGTKENIERSRLFMATAEAEAKGDWASVLTNVQQYRRQAGDPDDFSYVAGLAFLETGKPDSARIELRHSLKRYEPFHPSALWLLSWYQLGRAHEQLGNRGDAVDSYRTFLRYWGRADRPLPEVERARERIKDLAKAS
jgi:serine/threonine protein kinase/tetratricopeptide (TPR) repeat protein